MKKIITINDMVNTIIENTTFTSEEILKLEHDDFLDLYEKVIDLLRAKQTIKLREIVLKAKIK